jgi:hypothetical protein
VVARDVDRPKVRLRRRHPQRRPRMLRAGYAAAGSGLRWPSLPGSLTFECIFAERFCSPRKNHSGAAKPSAEEAREDALGIKEPEPRAEAREDQRTPFGEPDSRSWLVPAKDPEDSVLDRWAEFHDTILVGGRIRVAHTDFGSQLSPIVVDRISTCL